MMGRDGQSAGAKTGMLAGNPLTSSQRVCAFLYPLIFQLRSGMLLTIRRLGIHVMRVGAMRMEMMPFTTDRR